MAETPSSGSTSTTSFLAIPNSGNNSNVSSSSSSSSSTSIEFTKETISATPKASSALSSLLLTPRNAAKKEGNDEKKREHKKSVEEEETEDDNGEISPDIPFSCKIFLPSKSSFLVSITEPIFVSRLITFIIQYCGNISDATEINKLLTQIELVIANDQGERDDECPALDDKRPVHQFGLHSFLLRKVKHSTADISFFQPPNEPIWIGPKQKKATADVNTRLFQAAEVGKLGEFRKLVEYAAADVNATGIDNWTALHFASRYGHLPIVNYLLKQPIQIDALSKSRWTPLHLACERGHYEIAEMLLTCGADFTITDSDGHTASYHAQEKKFDDIVDLITEFQQQPPEEPVANQQSSTQQTPSTEPVQT